MAVIKYLIKSNFINYINECDTKNRGNVMFTTKEDNKDKDVFLFNCFILCTPKWS